MPPIVIKLKYGAKIISIIQAGGVCHVRAVSRYTSGPYAGQRLTQQTKPYKTERGALNAVRQIVERTKTA